MALSHESRFLSAHCKQTALNFPPHTGLSVRQASLRRPNDVNGHVAAGIYWHLARANSLSYSSLMVTAF